MQVSGVSVKRITVKGAADRSFLFPHETETPEDLQLTDFVMDFTDAALTDSKNRLMYLHEQQTGT